MLEFDYIIDNDDGNNTIAYNNKVYYLKHC